MSGSQQISLLRRSIFWLCILIAVAGVTYHYQENIFKEGFDSLTATNTPKDIPICNVKTNKKLVSLSFDADFGNEDIEKILSVLKKYDFLLQETGLKNILRLSKKCRLPVMIWVITATITNICLN